ncbi:MAG: hypothetical protein ACYTFV_11645 [Planctomycetota bacterium]|jgi:hypothetical protein
MLARTLPALLFGLFAGSARADITVLPDGSVGPVVGLAQALALAAPGETLFLMPGDYAGVTIDGQAVRIVGPGEDLVTIGTPSGAQVSQNLSVINLAFDQEVYVSGVRLDQWAAPVSAATFLVEDCEGPVVLHDVTALSTAHVPVATITANNVSTLVLDRCQVLGPMAPYNSAQLGGPALRVTDSRTFVNHCTIHGGYSDFELFGPTGQTGISANGGELFVHGGEVRGGAATIDPADTSGEAGSAIGGGLGRIELSGPVGSTIVGGAGFNAMFGSVPGAEGVTLTPGCTVLLFGGVDVQGGAGGDGTPAQPFLTFVGGELIEVADGQHRPGLSTSAPTGAPGGSFDLIIEGTPGRPQFVYFNLGLKRAYPVADFEGLALLEPTGVELLVIAITDSIGGTSRPVAVPPEPMLVGTTGWFQSYELQDASSVVRLGLPAGFRVN